MKKLFLLLILTSSIALISDAQKHKDKTKQRLTAPQKFDTTSSNDIPQVVKPKHKKNGSITKHKVDLRKNKPEDKNKKD